MASEADLQIFYSTRYYGVASQPSEADYLKRVQGAEIQIGKEIAPYKPKPGNFLEIGCGYGPVISAARNLGYYVTGIELGDVARTWAKQQQGLNVLGQDIEFCSFGDGEFDVIYSWHVIEHMPDMARFLRTVHRILKPGGIFFFGTENYRSVQNIYSRAHHWLGGSLPSLDTAEEHTFLFTPGLVRSILPRFGFEVDHVAAFQPHHKREVFFAPVRRAHSTLDRVAKSAVLGAVYAAASIFPGGGAHLKARVRRI